MTPNTIKTLVVGFAVLIAIILGWVGYRAANMETGQQQAATTPSAPPSRETPTPAPPAAATPGATPKAEGQQVPGAQAPAAAQAEGSATFDIVRVEPNGDAVIAGRATPGAKVELLRNGQVISTENANDQGEFVMTPSTLEPGDHQLQLRIAGEGGKTSERVVVVSVPKDGKGEALVVASEPNKPAQVMQAPAQAIAQAPATESSAAQADAAKDASTETANASPADNALLRIGAIEVQGGRLYAQGTGPAGSKLRIHLNDAAIADATVGPDGTWSLTIERGVTPGNYNVRIDQLGEDGRVTARAEAPFDYTANTVVATQPVPEQPVGTAPAASADASQQAVQPTQGTQPGAAPADAARPEERGKADVVVASVGTVKVRRGDSLWRISQGIYGQGIRYSVIYDANSDQIRDPDLIYPNQVFVVPSRN